MAKLVVLCISPKDKSEFDRHYVETHIPLDKKISGATSRTVRDGIVATPAGESGVRLVAILEFNSLAAVAARFRQP